MFGLVVIEGMTPSGHLSNINEIFFFQISSTATMVPRGSHRVVPNLNNVGASIVSDTSMSSTITRITNSFQVNGVGPPKKGAGPPVPPNKPTVSIYKPLSKLEGIVNSADARSGAIDLAK